jgi:hypothetical protein
MDNPADEVEFSSASLRKRLGASADARDTDYREQDHDL